ncbi:hypothetical protein [Dendronalium phyllosphericum]|nr:hypothetical protein [Dendronalium phyllosphericum]
MVSRSALNTQPNGIFVKSLVPGAFAGLFDEMQDLSDRVYEGKSQ